MTWVPGTEWSPRILGRLQNVPKTITLGGLDWNVGWVGSGQKSYICDGEGRRSACLQPCFCPFPANPPQRVVSILLPFGHHWKTHRVILVTGVGGHSDFLGRNTGPEFTLELERANSSVLQDYICILESLPGRYGVKYPKKKDKERREVYEEKGRRERKMREKPAMPVTWNKHVSPALLSYPGGTCKRPTASAFNPPTNSGQEDPLKYRAWPLH